MPFPAAADGVERKPPPKKGKSRSRRYHMRWCYREEPSNDDNGLYSTEVKSTNVQSARTSLLKVLNDGVERGTPDFLRPTDIVIVEARVLERGEYLPEPDDESEEA